MVIGGGIDEDEISTLVYSTYVNPGRLNYTTNLKGTQDTQVLNTASQVTNYKYIFHSIEINLNKNNIYHLW